MWRIFYVQIHKLNDNQFQDNLYIIFTKLIWLLYIKIRRLNEKCLAAYIQIYFWDIMKEKKKNLSHVYTLTD